MAFRYTPRSTTGGVLVELAETRLLRADRRIAWAAWSTSLGRATMRTFMGLIDNGRAEARDDGLFLPHATVAALPDYLALKLGLPPLVDATLSLRFHGRIDGDGGHLGFEWKDAGQRTVRPARDGALIDIGGAPGRLTSLLFDLCEAAEAFNASIGRPIDERIAAWAPVQSILADGTGKEIRADGYARSLTFYQAGAFSLDIVERAHGPDFTPVLMRRVDTPPCDDGTDSEEFDTTATTDDSTPAIADVLLPEVHLKAFVDKFSDDGANTRNAYVLGRNTYVVIPPDVKIALDVVRAKRRAPRDERRAFLRNPRAAIAAALEQTGRTVAPIFVETAAYSARVEGLGLWNEIVLPPTKRGGDWLPEAFEGLTTAASVAVTLENVDDIIAAVKAAEERGEVEIEVGGRRAPIAEVKPEIERVVAEREALKDEAANTDPTEKPIEGDERPEGLVTKENIDEVAFSISLRPRKPLVDTRFPHDRMSSNRPKAHQIEGFDWLVEAWTSGWPGVLLADDMGLGKTYQALAFLAWIRANLEVRGRHHPTAPSLGPMLVVAPTSLLRNWLAEAGRHLSGDGLGEAVEAFGTGLRSLKRPKDADWTPEDSLDVARLREADWILTTYETLADNHRAFARVPYSLVIFDEMQKIKEPGSINTRSAKTLNADFVLGLTGTPIENRLEDLWSIFDRLAPGHLGALRDFSRTYGAEDRDALQALKAQIEQRRGSVPAPMLRRMKDKARDGLPDKRIARYDVAMPARQADAYAAIIADAHGAGGSRRHMLEILHRMRGVSLHPDRDDGIDATNPASIDAWLARSARLAKATDILKEIRSRGEKAIVFVEDIAIQRIYAEAMATRFDLDHIPGRIDGSVTGDKRQKVVDEFQSAPRGFDMLVLSPRAAGVGLTITAANHVIHLSRWWNPAVEDQCNDRAYRIGQTKDVTIHLPLAIHPTFGDHSFDRKLDQLLEAKRHLSRDMLAPPESEDDLQRLFGGVLHD